MKQKLIIVAGKLGYQTRLFAETAERLGLEVIMATDRCGSMDDPWGDHAIPMKFHHPESSAQRLAQEAEGAAGIIAVGDRPTPVAALAAQSLGLRFHPHAAVEAARNKFIARERYAALGLAAPGFFRFRLDDGPNEAVKQAPWPCVLKPLGLSGSRGVIRANEPGEFLSAFERIRRILELPDIRRLQDEADRWVQVEEYIPGREFAIEGLMTAGALRTLAVFDKPDPLEGPFFEETIYVTPSTEPKPFQAELCDTVRRACRALGLRDGPIHAELRAGEKGIFVLEVAGRPIGGLCAKALQFNGGTSLEEVIVRHSLGEEPGELLLDGPASGVMMIPIPKSGVYEGVDGVEDASTVAGVTDIEITAKQGQTLQTLPEGSSYLGFVFARGETPGFVAGALKDAHSRLRFRIADMLPMLGRTPALS
jgi:hypothetical protein